MTDKEKLVAIASNLLASTVRGRTKWEETAEATRFETSLEDCSIIVFLDRNNLPTIGVLNKSGRLIEQTGAIASDPSHKVISALYRLARRQALRVDEILDKVLRSLTPGAPTRSPLMEEGKP